jgi:hypothetical protein
MFAPQPRTTPVGVLNVISLEGLIAFKLQGLVNDPRRTQDLEHTRMPSHADSGPVRGARRPDGGCRSAMPEMALARIVWTDARRTTLAAGRRLK